jgi:hypothetical protein
MAATPESKVKKQVVNILKGHGAYFFYPVTGGYGRSGVPDIVACWKGRFIGIECKARGNVPTQLQMKNLYEIADRGGISLIVDETGIGMLVVLMSTWESGTLPTKGYIAELTETNTNWSEDGTKPRK